MSTTQRPLADSTVSGTGLLAPGRGGTDRRTSYPVDLSLLRDVTHMPALPVLERSMGRGDLRLRDFCIPINPYFPSPEFIEELRQRLGEILRYYPSDNATVSHHLSSFLGLDAANVVVANGSTELISWINERLITSDLVTDVPTFGRWTDNPCELGRTVHTYFRLPSTGFRLDVGDFLRFAREKRARALVVCNPNNPTGGFLTREELLHLLDETVHMDLVVIDESFIDFALEGSIPSVADEAVARENVIVLKSLGKNLGLHGLRCGYAVACETVSERLRQILPPWNVNSLAEALIRSLAGRKDEYEIARRATVRDAQSLQSRLSEFDEFHVFPSNANFVFCELKRGVSGTQIRDALLVRSGCFVRECGSKIGAGSQYLRIAARPEAEQRVLATALRCAFAEIRRGRAIRQL